MLAINQQKGVSMKTRKLLSASAVALNSSLAATQARSQAFVRGSIGQSDIEEEIAAGLITSGSVDGKDTAFKCSAAICSTGTSVSRAPTSASVK